jgi:glycosyltransferase involved in cell wall biosynthesis
MNCPPGTRLMMTADTVGGVWTFAANLARELGAAGFEVLLVTLGPRASAAQRAMVFGVGGVSLLETDLALEWQDPAGVDMVHARAVMEEIVDQFKPQIVHLNGFREATFGWEVPAVVVAHSCVNSWAAACGESDAFTGQEWRTYTANLQAGLRQATAWVAPTSAFREQLRRLYRLQTPGHVIRNGAEPGTGQSRSRQPVILGAGRVWDKAKNMKLLTSVAPLLEWPVRIAGASDAEGSTSPGGFARCRFLGELSHAELQVEFGTASAFVSPAFYEPFGLSVLEAATAGCALVLSDIPTFRELWDGAAQFFDPRDERALVECLRSVILDHAQRTRLQRAASERAGRYPLTRTVASYCSLYHELSSGSAGRASSSEAERMIA